MKLTSKYFLLLLLYSPVEKDGNINIPISGRTRLMKMGFLFKEELMEDFKKDRNFEDIILPEFFAWKYGPFSKDLLNDLEFLVNRNFIRLKLSAGNEPIPAELAEYDYWSESIDEFETKEYEEEVFELSEKGIDKTISIWDFLTYNQKEIFIKFKKILTFAPLEKILDYVYKKYEKLGYTDHSLIREKYLR